MGQTTGRDGEVRTSWVFAVANMERIPIRDKDTLTEGKWTRKDDVWGHNASFEEELRDK